MINENTKIISENDINLYGRTYKEITYEDGTQILKRYNENTKMWVTLKFSKTEDKTIVEDLINLIVHAL